jgi:hypothetical protein
MPLTRADRLRVTLLSSLGLLPVACGARVEQPSAELNDSVQTTGHGGTAATPDESSRNDEPSRNTVPDPPESCMGSPVISAGVDTGLVSCASGVVHRPVPAECPNHLDQRGTADVAPPCEDDSCAPPSTCRSDADCTAKPYGFCNTLGQIPSFTCTYGCVTDADCAADEACVCGQYIGECVKANCRSADDCEAGYLCTQFRDLFGIGCNEPMQLACQGPNDECRTGADCASDGSGFANCSAPSGSFRCATVPGIACGRPFLVDGEARLAPVSAGRDGGFALCPRLDGLDAGARDRLARAWLEVGRMEHASIAAFARFCLQLLELGAPRDLLVAAQAAMADETEHTRLAFALASHYAGTPLGPGALPMDGALRDSRLEAVLLLVVREGCAGETIATLEAEEALAHAEDPIVRGVLERIARDERAHAELAWRFVAWALQQRPELASVVERELEGAEAHRFDDAAAPAALCSARLAKRFDPLQHGILTGRARAAVHAAAWRDVVRPCARSLLAQA